jgi:hypothetical protein
MRQRRCASKMSAEISDLRNTQYHKLHPVAPGWSCVSSGLAPSWRVRLHSHHDWVLVYHYVRGSRPSQTLHMMFSSTSLEPCSEPTTVVEGRGSRATMNAFWPV